MLHYLKGLHTDFLVDIEFLFPIVTLLLQPIDEGAVLKEHAANKILRQIVNERSGGNCLTL